ncbi:MAG: cell division protein ZapA [Elusimicrobiota bacterium]|nr:cell division protein ZapA [Elusimicrobiota bacterium]
MAKERVSVKILNSIHDLETDTEPLFVNQLAEYVNKKLQEVGKEQNTQDTTKILSVGLIILAEEIFKLKEEKENIETELDKNVDELILHLDAASHPR